MFYQLGLGEWLAGRLKSKIGIDLADQQDWNKSLARRGSAGQIPIFTMDLASASDSMSRNMIREVFPRDFVAWLDLLRSPESTLPDGRVVKLHMVSTMGNGFTFPLQTLLFTACVYACYQFYGIPFRARETGPCLPTFGVFGDDIIADTRVFDALSALLGALGFTQNSEKTFKEGPFRESCGGDYLRGFPVRGVYIKSLATAQERAVAFNRLNQWSAVTGIPLPWTIQLLGRSVPFRPVPLWEADDAGLKLPLGLCRKAIRRSLRYQSYEYRKWVAEPRKLRFTDVVIVPRGSKKRIYNPFGVMISFLRGDVMSGAISIRDSVVTRYRTKICIAPNWDCTADQEINPGGLAQLQAALEWNNFHFLGV
jgi:hypothetical protein